MLADAINNAVDRTLSEIERDVLGQRLSAEQRIEMVRALDRLADDVKQVTGSEWGDW
jgi:hypothetical protein